MTSTLVEIIRVAAGSLSGILAIAFLWVTVRSLVGGRAAYEANRIVTFPNLGKTISGSMRDGKSNFERRTNHGLAINLRTKKLESQQRLSSEAIDDVIGRRV